MAQLNIRMDDSLKEQGEKLFSDLGMSFSTAVNVFVSQSVREGGIPFAVTTKSDDPFYRASNMAVLKQSIKEADEGKLTEHELIED